MENKFHFDLIAKAIQYIKNYHSEQPSLEEISNHVHLSKFHFQRLFRKWVGVSPKEFLQYITVEHAKSSLKKGQSTLETAYNVGLSGNGRLHDLFVKIEACTPGEFLKRGKGIEIFFDEVDTPFGTATIAETNRGICSISFNNLQFSQKEAVRDNYPEATFINGLAKNGQLAQKYFQNWEIPTDKINLDLIGTPFQIQVWKALVQIPSSNLLSYQNIASVINNPKAVRAVGTAIGKNPIAYLIPCHRVIRNDGDSGSYRWNRERKIAINGYESLRLS